jgi:hypothetical protein
MSPLWDRQPLALLLDAAVLLAAFLCAAWGHWLYSRHQQRRRARKNARKAFELLKGRKAA